MEGNQIETRNRILKCILSIISYRDRLAKRNEHDIYNIFDIDMRYFTEKRP